MADKDDTKEKMKSILQLVKPAPAKKAAPRKKKEVSPTDSGHTAQMTANVTGNGNLVAGRDIVQNINKKTTVRTEFTPGPEHITSAMAKEIKDLVDDLVERGVASGGDQKKLYTEWWSKIKKRFNVPTYHAIPALLGESAIGWLKQQKAISRTKIRRTDNTSWRNEHYAGIKARCRDLEISKGKLLYIVEERLGKKVLSLTKLGDTDLKKLYQIIFAM